jgi:hypothetical protein
MFIHGRSGLCKPSQRVYYHLVFIANFAIGRSSRSKPNVNEPLLPREDRLYRSNNRTLLIQLAHPDTSHPLRLLNVDYKPLVPRITTLEAPSC